MQKKYWIGLSVFVVALLGLALLVPANDDYQVVKRAVEQDDTVRAQPAGGKTAMFFRLEVVSRKDKKESVSITLPLGLVDMLAENCKGVEAEVCKNHDLDFAKIWRDLRKGGPLTMIKVEDDDETVKIWLE